MLFYQVDPFTKHFIAFTEFPEPVTVHAAAASNIDYSKGKIQSASVDLREHFWTHHLQWARRSALLAGLLTGAAEVAERDGDGDGDIDDTERVGGEVAGEAMEAAVDFDYTQLSRNLMRPVGQVSRHRIRIAYFIVMCPIPFVIICYFFLATVLNVSFCLYLCFFFLS